jgi:hypothetical protein
LGELLNPTTAVVKEGAEKYVMAALAELGYLSEIVSGDNEGFLPSPGASEETINE